MKAPKIKKSTLIIIALVASIVILSVLANFGIAKNNEKILMGSKWEFDYAGMRQGEFDPVFAVSNLTLNKDFTFEWNVISDDGESSTFHGTYSVRSTQLELKYASGSIESHTIRIDDDKLILDDEYFTKVTGDFKKKTVYAKTEEATPSINLTTSDNSGSSSDNSGSSVVDDNAKSACWVLAKKAVKSQLNSPDSAKFSSTYSNSDVSITNSGNKYTVISWVQAENGYGGTVTNSFFVTMIKSGAGSDARYTVESCSIV
jgi:hypothetical protein